MMKNQVSEIVAVNNHMKQIKTLVTTLYYRRDYPRYIAQHIKIFSVQSCYLSRSRNCSLYQDTIFILENLKEQEN
ncbi:CLUMA_CG009210, isoform A [Clunio marinus]|uniref:CLUMA_CG009210, isoform A n=1 Tax=Clunio marinus TaxID=568069 RepID=A0A1J1IBD6_9DIPT|nr:CLUMA_CG009210, isoform A [Clunio marinus]